ncbi:hypothetical protein KPL35_05260 [Clostridium sp. CF011]|uniref:hypothetical protein n=1 Tax=Clostridium sp. CF011 TaxID=2843318 RepID=UPI001C0DCD82|nr:hypothetical protein [Clostridium sp. CF011]MBU3091478.1 hypothetical protein [Clostridium sp. CF011]WAG69286.1 hypothetical protein LL036_14980 [Clostridium sp. CF011]
MRQIRIFSNSNRFCLVTEVNDFIKNNKLKINDIQYSSTGGMFSTQYSVMIVIEEDEI